MNFKVNVQKYNMQMMVYFLLKEYIVQFYWMIKIRIKIINRKKIISSKEINMIKVVIMFFCVLWC